MPTLTVQPAAKDTQLLQDYPTINNVQVTEVFQYEMEK
jgi:uncharacterized protein (DUF433 family)